MPKDPLDVARGMVAASGPNGNRPNPERQRLGGQELALAKIDRFIKRTLEDAPPLTDEQRQRLARLLTVESSAK